MSPEKNNKVELPPFPSLPGKEKFGRYFDVHPGMRMDGGKLVRDESFVVKELTVNNARQTMHEAPMQAARSIKNFFESVGRSRSGIDEFLPSSKVIIGAPMEKSNIGQHETLYVVTDRVFGREIQSNEEANHFSSEIKQELCRVIRAFTILYKETFDFVERRGLTLEFKRPPNFMLEDLDLENRKVPRVWFVDEYPVLRLTVEEYVGALSDFCENFGVDRGNLSDCFTMVNNMEAEFYRSNER
jgi:hypothetical protein